MKTIVVHDVIGKSIAFSDEDAEKVYQKIFESLKEKEKVELTFKGIDMLISRFLNVAIGRLYKNFDNWEILDQAITYIDLEPDDKQLLIDKVIPTAKKHFADVARNEKIEIDVLK